VRGQLLKFLVITELDLYVDGPVLVFFVLPDADFTCATNTWKHRNMIKMRVNLNIMKHTIESGREPLADAIDQFLESWLPIVLQRVSISIEDYRNMTHPRILDGLLNIGCLFRLILQGLGEVLNLDTTCQHSNSFRGKQSAADLLLTFLILLYDAGVSIKIHFQIRPFSFEVRR
jgi:hypothetical protein